MSVLKKNTIVRENQQRNNFAPPELGCYLKLIDYHNFVPMGLKKKLHRNKIMVVKFNPKILSHLG